MEREAISRLSRSMYFTDGTRISYVKEVVKRGRGSRRCLHTVFTDTDEPDHLLFLVLEEVTVIRRASGGSSISPPPPPTI